MQIQKEESNGDLYQLCLYPVGVLPGSSPRQREGRRGITTEAKRRINKNNAKWKLMQLICANFTAGRDLFVCLTYKDIPQNEGRCLAYFHQKFKRAAAKEGMEHLYICTTEHHDREGEKVRVHHHLIMRGWTGEGGFSRVTKAISECWIYGTADMKILREGEDFFEDTAIYLLKEDKPDGARKYTSSRNLLAPNEPLRLRLPEAAAGEIPPGVTIVSHEVKANEFGKFEYMVGRIYDHRAFTYYWRRQQKKAHDPWGALKKRGRRKPK